MDLFVCFACLLVFLSVVLSYMCVTVPMTMAAALLSSPSHLCLLLHGVFAGVVSVVFAFFGVMF